MANELAPAVAAPIGESNTPWWYETPSLVSQSKHMTAYTSSTDSNPFDITPSVSSGYYEEDDGSNISDGSFSAHHGGAGGNGYHRTESNRSNSTLTNGRAGSNQVLHTEGTQNPDSSGTLVEESTHPNCYTINKTPPENRVTQQSAKPSRGGPSLGPSNSRKVKSRGVPVAPLKLEGEQPFSKAFMSPSRSGGKDESPSSLHQQRKDYENATVVAVETNSPLSHSMSAANQEILRYLAPQLMKGVNPLDLLPHLKRFNLLSDDEIDYIYDPKNSEKDKVKKILLTAPSKNGDSFDLFVECFEADGSHQAHIYLSRRLKDAIEKKRLYPFKRLSSLRGKSQHSHNHAHSHTHNQSWQAPPHGGSEHPNTVHHKATSPTTARASTNKPTSDEESKPQVPPKMRRSHNASVSSSAVQGGRGVAYQWEEGLGEQQASKLSQSLDPIFSNQDMRDISRGSGCGGSGRGSGRMSFDKGRYNPAPGNFASLPRRNSQSNDDVARGTKPYSSARYPSANQVKLVQPVPIRKLSRNASFHGTGDKERGIIVSPLDRNPAVLSEETEDDSYLYRKSSVDGTMFPNYENVSRRGSDDLTRQHPNYQNVGLGGIGSPTSIGPLPLSRRTHGVILEDPSATPSMEWEIMAAVNSTFPRRVPSRTNSMRAPGDGSVTLPASMVSPDFERRPPDRTSSLRRRTSLHGIVDMAPPPTPSHRGQYGGSEAPPPPPHGQRGYHSASHMQLHPVGGVANEKRGSGEGSYVHKHRRAQSYDISRAGLEESTELSGHRRVSEFFPRQKGEREEEREEEEEPARVADTVTVYSPGASGGGQDLNQQKMFKRKIQWLQQKVKFKDFSEELEFDSLTRYGTPRDILYSGTLYESGKARFVILMTDMILILKPKRKSGRRFGPKQQQFIDWFTDIDCKARRPLMLHLLSIQGKSRKTSSESFGLHYNKGSSLLKINLAAVSNEAKNIWLDNLCDAMRDCTKANATCTVPVRHNVRRFSEFEGPPRTSLSLTIVEANNIAYSANVTTKNHYCSVTLGVLRCRTPSVKAKCWPTWNFQCDFTDFELTDVLRIDFYTERITCPDDFLGFVEVNLLSASQKHQTQLGVTEMQLKKQHLPLREGKGTLTVDFELKWEEPANHVTECNNYDQ